MEANITISQRAVGNSLLQDVFDNLDSYLRSINSLRDAYYSNANNLSQQLQKKRAEFSKLNDRCNIKEENGITIVSVPNAEVYHYQKLYENVQQATRAMELVPPTYLVAMISAYDAFFGSIIKSIYTIQPQSLLECDIPFTYKELSNLSSINDVKKIIIARKTEELLRKSHIDQLKWFVKMLSLKSAIKFDGLKEFVEITQRRNLFVHSDGIVSEQYLSVCGEYEAIPEGVSLGAQLDVTNDYFDTAYHVLYRVGIMLVFTMLNVLFEKASDEDKVDIDEKLIEYIYYMIYSEHYANAIIVSKFALEPHFKHNTFNKGFYILNLAQSYKWKGDQAECVSILKKMDWSGCANELLLPRHVLLGEFHKAYPYMVQIGKSNKTITPAAYREWPIFKEFRKDKRFKEIYAEVFGEPFDAPTPLVIEADIPTGGETQVREEYTE